MTSSPSLTRKEKLREWMLERDITYRALAVHLGVTTQRVGYIIRRDTTMPPEMHAKCINLGFPIELLPEPKFHAHKGCPKIPRFPGLCPDEQGKC